jgi:8-oxo-dGTP pyrophosphatase MutT (NUDIX family)
LLEEPWDDLEARLRRLPRRRARPARDGESRRLAAVLVPLFRRDEALHALFIRRPETLRDHPGQVAFPGGTLHEGESDRDAALREAEEEVGLARDLVTPLGALHDVDTSTGFVLTPWVACIPTDLRLAPNPGEVARLFEAPLAELARVRELRTWSFRRPDGQAREWTGPAFPWDGELIWGATARVVDDLLSLLEMAPQA